jgi:hypothetical protein
VYSALGFGGLARGGSALRGAANSPYIERMGVTRSNKVAGSSRNAGDFSSCNAAALKWVVVRAYGGTLPGKPPVTPIAGGLNARESVPRD